MGMMYWFYYIGIPICWLPLLDPPVVVAAAIFIEWCY